MFIAEIFKPLGNLLDLTVCFVVVVKSSILSDVSKTKSKHRAAILSAKMSSYGSIPVIAFSTFFTQFVRHS